MIYEFIVVDNKSCENKSILLYLRLNHLNQSSLTANNPACSITKLYPSYNYCLFNRNEKICKLFHQLRVPPVSLRTNQKACSKAVASNVSSEQCQC